MPDPQITRAKCADGMIITIKEDSQRDKQHTRGFAGCSVQRVCYRVVVVSFLSIENPEAALFQTGFGSDARQFEELRQRKRSL